MRDVDRPDPQFPLGTPVNRKPDPGLVPVPGRPGWWRDKQGNETYIEPPRPSIFDLFIPSTAQKGTP